MMGERIDGLYYEIELRAKDFDRSSQQVKAELKRLNKTGGATEKAFDDIGDSSKRAARDLGDTSKKSDKTRKALAAMAKKAAAAVAAFMGFQAISRVMGNVVRSTAKFDQALGQVETLTSQTGAAFDQLKRQVRGLNAALPQTESDLAMGLYQTLSSGVQDASDAMIVLEASAKLAASGLLDTNTAVDAVTTVLNAYGMEAQRVNEVTDAFVRIVQEGKLTIPGLAQNIGTVATSAALAGVSIDEIGAALATMTKLGIDATEATSALNRFLLTIIQPTDEMAEAAGELGIQWSAAALSAKGLGEFMRDVADATDGNVEKLAELNPNIRAARAAFVLAGSGADEFTKILGSMEEKTGAANEAFQKTNDRFIAMWDIVKGRIRNVLTSWAEEWLPSVIEKAEYLVSLFEDDFTTTIRRMRELGVDETFIQDLTRHHEIRKTTEALRDARQVLLDFGLRPDDENIGTQIEVLGAAADESRLKAAGLQRELAQVVSRLETVREEGRELSRGPGFAPDELRSEAIQLAKRRDELEKQLEPLEEQIERYERIRGAMVEIEQLEERRTALMQSQVGGAREDAPVGLSSDAKAAIESSGRTVAMEFRRTFREQLLDAGPLEVTSPVRVIPEDAKETLRELEAEIEAALGHGVGTFEELMAAETEINRLLGSGNDEMVQRGEHLDFLVTKYRETQGAIDALKEATSDYNEALMEGDEEEVAEALEDLEKALVAVFRKLRKVEDQAEETGKSGERGWSEFAEGVEDVLRGVLALSDAFDVLDDDSRKALEGAVEAAAGIEKVVTTGGTSVSGWVQTIGGMAKAIAGVFGGGDEEARKLRFALQELRQSVIELKDAMVIGEDVSVDELRKLIGVFTTGRAGPNANKGGLGSKADPYVLYLMEKVGEALGIDLKKMFKKGESREEALDVLKEIMGNLGTVNLETVNGQLEYFSRLVEQMDMTDAIDQMEMFMDQVVKEFAPSLLAYDVTTAEGRKAMSDFLATLTQTLATEGVSSHLIQSTFGSDLSAGEIQELLEQMDSMLDSIGGEEGDEGQSYSRNVQITEARAGRLLAMTATMVTRQDQLVELARMRNALLESIAGVMGATEAAAAGDGTKVAAMNLTNTINVSQTFSGPGGASSSGQGGYEMGRGIGDSVAEQISRDLAILQARSDRAAGKV